MNDFDDRLRLFKLKVRERVQQMLREIAARPQPQGFRRYIEPAVLHPDLVSEVQRCISLFRTFLHDVNEFGSRELKPTGQMDTSEFIREVLRPHFFNAFSEYEEIFWRAVTEIPPGWGSVTNAIPARELFEKERGILKDSFENRFDMKAIELAQQESRSTLPLGETRPNPSKRARKAGSPTKENEEVAKRRALVRSNPNVPAKEVCEIFDRKAVPLPSKWQDAGYKSWRQVYADPTYRNRIKVLISKDTRT